MSEERAAIYLVAGPDFGRREQAVKKICAAVEAREREAGGVERGSCYADDTSVDELMNRLYNRTLFHAHLLIVYRSVETVRGTTAHGRLKQYIRKPSQHATLILVSEDTAQKVTWAKEIPKKYTIPCWQPFENEIATTIRELFRAHNKRVSAELAGQIGGLCEQDSHLAVQLCHQIIYFFHAEEEITSALLFEFIDEQHAASVFHLTDQLFARDTKKAVATLHRLHTEQWSSDRIAGFVNIQMQKLWRTAYLISNGLPATDALKNNGVVWQRQVRTFQQGLSNFLLPELSRLITQHKDLEAEIRELPERYAHLLLTRLILQVCEGPLSPLVHDRHPSLVW